MSGLPDRPDPDAQAERRHPLAARAGRRSFGAALGLAGAGVPDAWAERLVPAMVMSRWAAARFPAPR